MGRATTSPRRVPVQGHRARPGHQTQAAILAEFCRAISWSDIDPFVRTRAAELVLDFIGVTVGGLGADSTTAVHNLVLARPDRGAATIIGRRSLTSPEWAALANGTAGHALEMDDCTRESSLHPGVAVIPAGLAVAEELGLSVPSLLEAVVAGYEVTMRVGAALDPASAYRRGFHPTGVSGVFGAATAVARLLGLGPQEMTWALGIAGSTAAGSLEYLTNGAWTKRLSPGWAAHSGLVAARLAEAGFVGPETVFEGPLGFLHAYSGSGDAHRLTADLGENFQITRVAIKPYACCRYAHGVIDAVLELRTKHRFDLGRIARIELGVLSIATSLISEPIEQKRNPASIVDAQFSAPFAAAVALVTGHAGASAFSDDNVASPAIRDLMAKTTCYTDPALDAAFPSAMPAVVTIELANGERLGTRVEYPLGEPENPLSQEQIVERFFAFTAPWISPQSAEAVAQRLLHGSPTDTVAALMRDLRSGTTA